MKLSIKMQIWVITKVLDYPIMSNVVTVFIYNKDGDCVKKFKFGNYAKNIKNFEK